jgi:hypothetical protein
MVDSIDEMESPSQTVHGHPWIEPNMLTLKVLKLVVLPSKQSN